MDSCDSYGRINAMEKQIRNEKSSGSVLFACPI